MQWRMPLTRRAPIVLRYRQLLGGKTKGPLCRRSTMRSVVVDLGAQNKVFETIRNAANAREAAQLLMRDSPSISSPPGGSLSSVGSEAHLFGMGNLLAQSTRPTINVPAKPWTTVTDDDELVSHLVSLYFCWDYPVHCFFDRQLFLADMVSGRERFCSKLLVNTLLSYACVSYPQPSMTRIL